MDAYDIADLIKKLWAEHIPKDSGVISKSKYRMPVVVWTEEGYRQVVGITYNSKLNLIQLEMDSE